MKKHCDENPNETLTESEIQLNSKTFESIKGISSQALEDFKKITKKQCLIYHPLIGFVSLQSIIKPRIQNHI